MSNKPDAPPGDSTGDIPPKGDSVRRAGPFIIDKPPFPWFGGKSRVADIVWERFGDVPNYVEPFAGSLAVLLRRPHLPKTETVNDLDCYLANFWRAVCHDPEAVAAWCDWPVNEACLHARHVWLLAQGDFRERMKTDPDFYDAKLAGWWVWGQCQWIGSGWCDSRFYNGGERAKKQRPHLLGRGMGVHRPSHQLPHLLSRGMSVHRPSHQRPHLGDPGRGVHRPSQKLPHLGDPGMGGELLEYFLAMAARLRRVRVCCGDWTRVCGPTPTTHHGLTGVFLDPPYGDSRKLALYAVDDVGLAEKVRDWAVERGNDKQMRIALCGYEGETEMPDSWECVPWKTQGGYGTQGDQRGRENANRERVWFSPHCIVVNPAQRMLPFGDDS